MCNIFNFSFVDQSTFKNFSKSLSDTLHFEFFFEQLQTTNSMVNKCNSGKKFYLRANTGHLWPSLDIFGCLRTSFDIFGYGTTVGKNDTVLHGLSLLVFGK